MFDLPLPAVMALLAQKDHTFGNPIQNIERRRTEHGEGGYQSEAVRFFFVNPNSGEPFNGSHNMDERVWKPVIEASGVRYRSMSQTRHTFASQCISHHWPIEKVAHMMGHSSPQTTRKHYAKWIPQDMPDDSDLLNRRLEVTDYSDEVNDPAQSQGTDTSNVVQLFTNSEKVKVNKH